MEQQLPVVTRPPSLFLKRFYRLGLPLMAAACVLLSANPAQALIKMDSRGIDAALVYGMKSQNLGIATILGPNWVEGDRGALLNVYSPFMVLATKAAKSDLSTSPSQSDLQKAREKYGKWVHFYKDEKNKPRVEVKFAVSFYGNSPEFAKSYEARIVGFGRGKEFEIRPAKRYLDQIADPVVNGGPNTYEAVNSYYFKFSEMEDLQEFRFIMESPYGEPYTFRLNNEKLY